MSNAHEHLINMRDSLGEASASHWKDRQLLTQLNKAQSRLGQRIALANGAWLEKSASVTPVASVITLPTDCAKPVYLEETVSGNPIPFSTEVMDRRVSRPAGTTLLAGVTQEAYFQRGSIVVNSTGYTTVCTLWYQMRVPDLHVGTASAGGAASFTLDDNDGEGVSTGGHGAKTITDYYNTVEFKPVSGTGAGAVDTITDYTSGRVATVTGTYSSSTVYGTISKLPEESWDLMELEATMVCLAKPSSVIDPQAFTFLRALLREAREGFDEWISTPFRGGQHTRVTELED